MALSSRQRRGAEGEDAALAHLTRKGLRLVMRNIRLPGGEIDLVMLDGQTLVFVEVRRRSTRALVNALESVNTTKQHRLLRAARNFLARYPEHGRRPCRFDVITLTDRTDGCAIEWLPNAFEDTPA